MPPFEITDVDDIARVTIFTNVSTTAAIAEFSFSHYIRGCAGLSPAAVGTAIETPLATLLGATTADGLRLVLASSGGITKTRISKPLVDPQPVSVDTSRGLAGAVFGIAPPDLAMVVSFQTDTSGAAFRGRSYVGGLGKDTIDNTTGLYSASMCTALAADWNTYLTQLQALAGEFEQITVSLFENVGGVPTPRATPLGATVTLAKVDRHADVQRRRGVR